MNRSAWQSLRRIFLQRSLAGLDSSVETFLLRACNKSTYFEVNQALNLYSLGWISSNSRALSFSTFVSGQNGSSCEQISSESPSQQDDLEEGRHSADDVQFALEEAMVEAYRLLKEDKVEQAEILVTEGLVAGESVLDARDPSLAQIWDQAALLQFFQGRFKEAEVNCLKSLEAAKSLTNDQGRSAAIGMCQLRLGTILLGQDHREKAAGLLAEAYQVLASNFDETFSPLLEARFYMELVSLPKYFSKESLQDSESQLLEALKSIKETPTVGLHLLRAAFREHRTLMDGAVNRSDWELAEAILLQASRFQQEICPDSDESALTTYQYATLQYVRGYNTEAMSLCEDSLNLARRLYKKDIHSQVALRLHRIGTIHLAKEAYSEASEILEVCTTRLARSAGDANPLTGESRCALALAKLALLKETAYKADAYMRVLLPKRKADLESEARQGLLHMKRGFGEDHMLVKKLESIYKSLI